jgi:hypothetical protein
MSYTKSAKCPKILVTRYAWLRATRYAWWRVLVLFGWALAPNVAYTRGIRVVLLDDAEVQGDVILLANLLPPYASYAMRDAAARISLGTSPQNGSARRLSADAIVAAIQDSGLPATSFFVPQTVTIRRSGRALTRQEAWAAIQAFLGKHPVNALRTLRADDLTLDAGVSVSSDSVKLVVTRLTFDDALHRARFRLRLQGIPSGQPFYVTARVPSGTTGLARPAFGTTSRDMDSFAPASAVLVDPRQSARLHLHSADSDMLLTVQPLQRGTLGQTIRVRLRASGKTLQARVVSQNTLDAVF